jgi:hypothetical protein
MKLFTDNGVSRMNNRSYLPQLHRTAQEAPMLHHFSDGTGRDQYIK